MLLSGDESLVEWLHQNLSEKEIRECFEVRRMLRHVDFIFRRVLRSGSRDRGL